MTAARVVVTVASAAFTASCSLPRLPALTDSAGVAPGDAAMVDFPLCTTNGVSCSNDSLLTCAVGTEPVVEFCGWGCATTGTPHCEVLTPTGGAATSSDTLASALDAYGAETIGSGTTIDTDTGTITGGSGMYGTGSGSTAAIFKFGTLDIVGKPTLTGSKPLVLIANGVIEIGAVVDLEGACLGGSATLGGGRGGSPGVVGLDPCTNTASGMSATATEGGGGGGGYGAAGGAGSGGIVGGGGVAGAAYGAATIPTLCGGGGGGGGDVPSEVATGGAGGGALQLISNTSVTITSGGINAGGCGGTGSVQVTDGTGGGGAGGTVVIEAPSITFASAATLAVNGGAGGTVGGGLLAALAGQLSSTPATGSTGGGNGGAGTLLVGAPGTAAGFGGGGGGGGSVGRMRFNTRGGTQLQAGSATLSPSLSAMGTTTTQGTATTQ